MDEIDFDVMRETTMALPNQNGGDAWRAHMAMTAVQVFQGGYLVITKVALNIGVNQMVFCVLRGLLALLILVPFAYVLEKRQRLPLNRSLLVAFFFLGLTGILGNQLLFLLGLGYTNPTFAAAMQPSVPVFTFILAVMMGTETLNLRKAEDRTKLSGIIICVSGAFLMALFRGPALLGQEESEFTVESDISAKGQTESSGWLLSSILELGISHWHLGVLCLVGNCMCMATYLTIQKPVLMRYPASVTVTAFSFFFGTTFMVIIALFVTNGSSDWILSKSEITIGIVSSALNYGLVTWSNKTLGPSLVALYSPLQPAASAFLSKIFLGSPIYLGSILGGVLIIAGLYLVIWASDKEKHAIIEIPTDGLSSEHLIEKGSSTSTQKGQTRIFVS